MKKRLLSLCSITFLLSLGCTMGIAERDVLTPTPFGADSTRERPTDGMVMVHVLGGTFPMGSAQDEPSMDTNEFPNTRSRSIVSGSTEPRSRSPSSTPL